jgi:hypothetical protein
VHLSRKLNVTWLMAFSEAATRRIIGHCWLVSMSGSSVIVALKAVALKRLRLPRPKDDETPARVHPGR